MSHPAYIPTRIRHVSPPIAPTRAARIGTDAERLAIIERLVDNKPSGSIDRMIAEEAVRDLRALYEMLDIIDLGEVATNE